MVKSDVMNKDASLSIVWLCCPDLDWAMGRRCKDSASADNFCNSIQIEAQQFIFWLCCNSFAVGGQDIFLASFSDTMHARKKRKQKVESFL